MRVRKSEGVIERYGVTLSPGLPAESKIIEALLDCPKGRRQQWLRKLLMLGIQNRQISLPIIDNWTLPQGDPVPNKLLSIGLDRRAPEDLVILSWVETLPLVRRSQALRSLLVIGIYVASMPVQAIGITPLLTEAEKKTPASCKEEVVADLKSPTGRLDCQLKSLVENEGNAPILALRTQKFMDNPPKVVVLDASKKRSELSEHKTKNVQTFSDNEVDELPSTETVISGLQYPIPLDIDLSEFDGEAPELPKKLEGLAAMRGLFN